MPAKKKPSLINQENTASGTTVMLRENSKRRAAALSTLISNPNIGKSSKTSTSDESSEVKELGPVTGDDSDEVKELGPVTGDDSDEVKGLGTHGVYFSQPGFVEEQRIQEEREHIDRMNKEFFELERAAEELAAKKFAEYRAEFEKKT